MKFIFVNGPPRSGKDEAAFHLAREYDNVVPVKFAKPLYNSIQVLFGLTSRRWAFLYQNHKDEPCAELHGMTPRNALIWMSEDVMKPKFGQDVFGRSMVSYIQSLKDNLISNDTVFIASDSGFLSEAIPVIECIGVDNCFQVQLYRQGCDFSSDSRGYWTPPDDGLQRYMIFNNGTLADYYEMLDGTYADIKGE